MNPDRITSAVATLGLLNNTIRIMPADGGRPVFMCAGKQAYFRDPAFEKRCGKALSKTHVLEYLPKARFADVRDGVSDTLGEMSLKAPDMYDEMLREIHSAGTSCYAVSRPAGNIWPLAMERLWPELCGEDDVFAKAPYARLFQCQQLAALLCVDGDGLEDAAAWCAENPTGLSRTGPYADDSFRYEGLRPDGAGTAVFWIRPVDIASPWAVVSNPDGSEDVAPGIRPMMLESSLLNLWTDAKPGMGWFVIELRTGAEPELYRFPDKNGAELFVAAQYESELDALERRGVADIDPASGIGLDGGQNVLIWSEPGARRGSSVRWHIHEGYEGFGLK